MIYRVMDLMNEEHYRFESLDEAIDRAYMMNCNCDDCIGEYSVYDENGNHCY